MDWINFIVGAFIFMYFDSVVSSGTDKDCESPFPAPSVKATALQTLKGIVVFICFHLNTAAVVNIIQYNSRKNKKLRNKHL